MVPANVNDKYVIRFCAVAQNVTEDDIGEFICLDFFLNFNHFFSMFSFTDYAWKVIVEYANELLENQEVEKEQVRMKTC